MIVHPPKRQARWTDAFLNAKRFIGDPPADAVVEQIFAAGDVDAVSALMRTLVVNDQPPPEQLPEVVRQYFEESQKLPDWADPEQIRRGEEFFLLWGPQLCMMLFCASLPTGYAMVHAVKILHLTARLETDARRRIIETAQFLLDVMSPGALSEGGQGIRAVQKVRLMHAAVRYLIRAKATQYATPDALEQATGLRRLMQAVRRAVGDKTAEYPSAWSADWGVPINQELLAGTVLEFSLVPLLGLKKLGARVSPEDAEAYLHTWKVIGHLLGVTDDLLPANTRDAYAQARTIQRRHIGACPEGRAMTSALVELANSLAPLPVFDGLPEAMIAHLIGRRYARLIGVNPSGPARLKLWLFRPLIWLTYHFPGHHRRLARLTQPLGMTMLEHCPLVDRGGYRAPFQIPTELAQRWNIGEAATVTAEKQRFDQVAAQRGNRPHPVPARPWSTAQTWDHLLFMHWPVPVEALRPFVPSGMEIETFNGTAWLSLVAMRYRPAHFRHFPPIPNLPLPEALRVVDVPELNTRTYVRVGGRSGVHCLSIDTGSWLISQLARHMFDMPYAHSDVKMKTDGDWIDFRCTRQRDDRTARLICRYRSSGERLAVEPGSLDEFLHERYMLLIKKDDGHIYAADLHHGPWDLHAADASIEENDLGEWLGLGLTQTQPIVRYVRASDVLAWSPEPVAEPVAQPGS